MSAKSGGEVTVKGGKVRLIELSVSPARNYLWGGDVFLGRVPLIKLHFLILLLILIGVWWR